MKVFSAIFVALIVIACGNTTGPNSQRQLHFKVRRAPAPSASVYATPNAAQDTVIIVTTNSDTILLTAQPSFAASSGDAVSVQVNVDTALTGGYFPADTADIRTACGQQTPDSLLLARYHGTSAQLQATVVDSLGAEIPNSVLNWSTDAGRTFLVTQSGRVVPNLCYPEEFKASVTVTAEVVDAITGQGFDPPVRGTIIFHPLVITN